MSFRPPSRRRAMASPDEAAREIDDVIIVAIFSRAESLGDVALPFGAQFVDDVGERVELFVGEAEGLAVDRRRIHARVVGGLEHQTMVAAVSLHQRARHGLALGHPMSVLGSGLVVLPKERVEFSPADHRREAFSTIFLNSASTRARASRHFCRSISLFALALIFSKASAAKKAALCADNRAQRASRSSSCRRAMISRAR